ncbi:hypothetical protein RvY_15137 [Ramazzottius varieornatus]|uniref:Uncharacterized protein n=2 Tax=Ramazzottius varieornatus TaxID=947166 RepID=A0A1D1VTU7_RAMVA|nr:hypothetical protein RvY_15137 [Ramazzottius varieornatus]
MFFGRLKTLLLQVSSRVHIEHNASAKLQEVELETLLHTPGREYPILKDYHQVKELEHFQREKDVEQSMARAGPKSVLMYPPALLEYIRKIHGGEVAGGSGRGKMIVTLETIALMKWC